VVTGDPKEKTFLQVTADEAVQAEAMGFLKMQPEMGIGDQRKSFVATNLSLLAPGTLV